MITIGGFNKLQVVKEVNFGVYLDGHDMDTILLPKRYVPDGTQLGDWINVFIYLDSEDILIATTESPLAKVGECAHLKVTDVNNAGAFLDWGLPKDLLVPYGEQHTPLETGKSYVIHLYVDEYTDRIVGTSRLNRHLSEQGFEFEVNQKVDLLICGKTDMGYKVVVNHTHLALIFRDDAFKPLKYGQKTHGYIKNIRQDGKLDISLQLPAGLGRDALTSKILSRLHSAGGSLPITDKTHPDEIYKEFNVSKNTYKKAIGALYKQKKIIISPEQIKLTTKT